jgi:hypothetical protein
MTCMNWAHLTQAVFALESPAFVRHPVLCTLYAAANLAVVALHTGLVAKTVYLCTTKTTYVCRPPPQNAQRKLVLDSVITGAVQVLILALCR